MIDARTAINQLAQAKNGFARLESMIGAKNFVQSQEQSYVSFKFMCGAANKANYLKITLLPSDTYSLEFGKIHGLNYKAITTLSGVYAEDLKRIFEEETKLYLSL